jgi:hypothetical protein
MLKIEDGFLGLSGGRINLDTVASRNNHVLPHGRNGVDLAEGVFQLILRKGQAFPKMDWSCIVI